MSVQLYLSDGKKLTPGVIERTLLSALQPKFAIYRPRIFEDFHEHPEDTVYSIVVVDSELNVVEESYVPKGLAEAICDGPVYFLDVGPTPPIVQMSPVLVDGFLIRTRFVGNESNIPKILNSLF